VRLVHDTVEAVTARRRHIAGGVAALACCGALLAGCGSESATVARPAHLTPQAQLQAVATVRQASCTDWEKGDSRERHNTVLDLRLFAGGQVGSSKTLRYGRVLNDARAYKVLDSWCGNYFARGFKLYKLYERAAAFVGQAPSPKT
jgi:hypothetical protein